MSGITLVWEISSRFVDSNVTEILDKYNGKGKKTPNEYERWVWKGVGITVKRYDKKLVVQGTENAESLKLVSELAEIETLKFDKRNAEKFAKLFPTAQNAIFCTECNRLSLVIEGKIEGLDIIFRKECGHKNNMKPPLFMCTHRILPDVNTLVSNNLSRFVKLGCFTNFEVVIPSFILHILDLLGSKEKIGASREINNLISLEKERKITIFNCNDGFEVPSTKEEFQRKEDDIILKITNLTNSILLTGDRNLKDKAVLDKRPTIYIHPKESKKVKIIKQIRSPK